MRLLQKECNLCGNVVEFQSIEKSLGDTLREKKFPYDLKDFETLNYKEYSCPKCAASDRDRLYGLYLEKFPLKENAVVVDFAPAPSLQRYLKKLPIQYRSADLFMKNVDDKVDITNMIQYEDNKFDFFVCSHLLEHVDDRKALSELKRILKPGGRGILMTPIIDKDHVFDEDMKVREVNERWRRFAQDDHVRLYSKKEFLKRVHESGLQVAEVTSKTLGKFRFFKNGIDQKSVLYIVEK